MDVNMSVNMNVTIEVVCDDKHVNIPNECLETSNLFHDIINNCNEVIIFPQQYKEVFDDYMDIITNRDKNLTIDDGQKLMLLLELAHFIDDDYIFGRLMDRVLAVWSIVNITQYNVSLNLTRQIYLYCPLYYIPEFLLHDYHFLLSWVKKHSADNKTNKIITVDHNKSYTFSAEFRVVNDNELMLLTSKLIEKYEPCPTNNVKTNNNIKHNNIYTITYLHGVSLQWYPISNDGNKCLCDMVYYQYNTQHGTHKRWYPNGILIEERDYNQGSLYKIKSTY